MIIMIIIITINNYEKIRKNKKEKKKTLKKVIISDKLSNWHTIELIYKNYKNSEIHDINRHSTKK